MTAPRVVACSVPESAWRWPNSTPTEIAYRCTGKLLLDEAAPKADYSAYDAI